MVFLYLFLFLIIWIIRERERERERERVVMIIHNYTQFFFMLKSSRSYLIQFVKLFLLKNNLVKFIVIEEET